MQEAEWHIYQSVKIILGFIVSTTALIILIRLRKQLKQFEWDTTEGDSNDANTLIGFGQQINMSIAAATQL